MTAAPLVTEPGAASRQHVLGRLDVLRLRVAALVAARRAVDAAPEDPFLGLYLSDAKVDALLHDERVWVPPSVAASRSAEVERTADAAAAAGAELRLRTLAARFGLDAVDVELLLTAMAPDVDDRFERYYGYLNDDVTRRRASVGLALGLCGLEAASAGARARLGASGALVRAGLVDVEDPERPLLTRGLRVPDRVTAHILGSDEPDAALDHVVTAVVPSGEEPQPALVAALGEHDALVYARDRESAAVQLTVDAAAANGTPAIVIDLRRLPGPPEAERIIDAAAREARLRGGVLVAGPLDEHADAAHVAARLAAGHGRLVLHGQRSWDPTWSRRSPYVVAGAPMSVAARARLWRTALGAGAEGIDIEPAVGQYRLGAGQIRQAAETALRIARVLERSLQPVDLRIGARQQNAAGLEHLARRIEAAVGWDDLVLPPPVTAGLRALADRARYRETVLGDWGMRPGGGRGTGVTALFAGDSGTGKTMSAEVIAADLGIDLYVVNLATVVDKYIGETEKNLDRIFAEAADVNGILLFDEADALFGQRSEINDSHDRYANIEVAYLLQRMETFDGLAVLSTNLRANIDEAFMRRLDVVVDFPLPDAELRLALWRRCLADVPCEPDLDVEHCAEAFELSGGNIRSVAITIGYRVAATGRPATTTDLVQSIGEEYRKLGRLCLESEFGRYYPLLRAPAP
jgi:hypothetical protein